MEQRLNATSGTKNISSSTIKPQSGYNIDLFIDKDAAQEYLCSICHHVVSDCHETTCGHIFCGGCICRVISMPNNKTNNSNNSNNNNNGGFKCPFCNKSNLSQPHKSIYLNRAVKHLKVHCPFNGKGCVWSGSLSDLMVNNQQTNGGKSYSHLRNCVYSPIICNKCNIKICRKDYETHHKKCMITLLNDECPICHIVFGPKSNGIDKKIHYSKCQQSMLIKCKFCKKEIQKLSLNHHISFLCSQRLIKCPFYHFSCNEMIKSINLSNHLKYNSQQHYQLKVDHCINKIDKLTNQIEVVYKLYDESKKQNENLTNEIIKLTQNNKKNQSLPVIEKENINNNNINNNIYYPDVLMLLGSKKWEESGIFIRRSILHETRVCYTSFRTKCAIRWNNELSAWLIDRRGLKNDNEASLIVYQNVIHPGLINQHWLVYNDDIGDWIQSTNFKIKSYNLNEFIFNTDKIFAYYSNYNDIQNIKNIQNNTIGKINTIQQHKVIVKNKNKLYSINDMNNTKNTSSLIDNIADNKEERHEDDEEDIDSIIDDGQGLRPPPGLL